MKTVFEIAEGGKKSSLVAPGSSPESVLAVEANRIHLQRSEPFLDALEAARFLKLHPKTLLRLARSGSIPAHPLTGRRRHIWRFLLSELDAWARAVG